MVGWNRTVGLNLAGLLGLAGYVLLGRFADAMEPRPWLWLAHGLGWLAVGGAVWAGQTSPRAGWILVGWAVVFRLAGLAVAPAWEDDYNRYLLDGYSTTVAGSPYGQAPVDFFAREEEAPDAVMDALDQINHPDLPTVYGPAPQLVFWLAARQAAGELWVLKLGWLGLEGLAWWLLWSRLRWVGAVGLLWCPLAVTEIGFAAHPEAWVILAVAIFVRGWESGKVGWMIGGAVVAISTKIVGLALVPFLGGRRGWGWAVLAVGLGGLSYLPFGVSGLVALGRSLGEMGSAFEYNSTGYALLQLGLGPVAGRWAAVVFFGWSAALIWWWWWRRREDAWPPVNAIWGVFYWWAPVFNPWYALWLLPLWAVQPKVWVLGVWWAVPLAYAHGWDSGRGLLVDYEHPAWARPAEVGVFAAVCLAGWFLRGPWARWLASQPMVAEGER